MALKDPNFINLPEPVVRAFRELKTGAQQEINSLHEIIATLLPAGLIEAFACQSPPSGWLECNGQAVSRTQYARLFAAIGTTFGAGDGSTTFNLPDLRGEFIRGWDHGRGIDKGRAWGSAQADELKSHSHAQMISESTAGMSYYPAQGYCGNATPTGPALTGASGGSETRPRNIALMYCIKY